MDELPQAPIKKSFPLWPFIVLIFLFLGLTTFLGYQNIKLQKQIAVLSAKSSPSPITLVSPSPSVVAEIPSDWKTYTNTKLGFSIQYPANWIIITDYDRVVGWSTFIADNKDKMTITKSLQVNIEYSNVFEIPFSGGKKVIIAKDNLGYYAYAGNTPATSTFQGRPAIKSLDSSPLYGAHTELRILDGKRLVEVKVDTKDDKETILHDQILSTFKFTE